MLYFRLTIIARLIFQRSGQIEAKMQGVYPVPRKPVVITPHPKQVKQSRASLVLVGSAAIIAVMLVSIAAVGLGLLVMVSSQRILPGVSVAGVSLSGLSADDATSQLRSAMAEV